MSRVGGRTVAALVLLGLVAVASTSRFGSEGQLASTPAGYAVLSLAVLLAGYALSLAPGHATLDRVAPLFAVGLLATVELGSWSLELRDRPEARPLAHVGLVLVLLVAAFAASLVVLAVGGVRADAGIALFAVGAAAALGLFALLAGPGLLVRR